MNIDLPALQGAIANAHGTLKEALLSGDIWDARTGLSLAGYNGQPAAVALFNDLTARVQSTLLEAGWPGLGKRYWLQLENEQLVIVLRFSPELLGGLLVDGSKTNLGVLVSVVLPRMLREVEATLA